MSYTIADVLIRDTNRSRYSSTFDNIYIAVSLKDNNNNNLYLFYTPTETPAKTTVKKGCVASQRFDLNLSIEKNAGNLDYTLFTSLELDTIKLQACIESTYLSYLKQRYNIELTLSSTYDNYIKRNYFIACA